MAGRSKRLAKKGAFGSWHVAVAAEAIAAAQFARCGVDVSVQYGANHPGVWGVARRGWASTGARPSGRPSLYCRDTGQGPNQPFRRPGPNRIVHP